MSNFTFLESRWSDLSKLGSLAEKYVYSDPNTSIIKQGMLAEIMVKYMLAYDGIKEPEYDNTHANRIRVLKQNDLLPYEISNTLYVLRKDRNDATHNASDEGDRALNNLKLCYELSVWFMQVYGDYDYLADDYVIPVDYTISFDELEKENKELEKRNKTLLIELQNIQKRGKADTARRAIAYGKAINIKLTEAQTRELIDEQLRKVGWEADTPVLRYSKGTRPVKGNNLAIAEWPTDSKTGNNGYADYALFIGEKLVGIVEAKKKHSNISSVLDGQCKDYAKQIKAEHQKYILREYGAYKVPFLFATNGRPYLKQYEEMSGIWYLDVREAFNSPKALSGWPSPEGVEQGLERDIAEANKKLLSTGYEVLEDPNGLNLRYYQIEAIKKAEEAIAEHKNAVLLAMATGTGKTRTVLGMIYRFLEAKRFKRILYLVDRTALGDQTMDTIKEVKLKELLTLDKMYDVKSLEDKEFEKDTRVHIATVQSLVKRILYSADKEKTLGISDYDLIIVDEAHRGYILDKEMGDDEVLYRNQDDFRSKYRAVIDYFDAVKIALTATPALHTTQIFGKPVYTYNYRTAVIDGFLVDHDAPHLIKTKLSEEGIRFVAGNTVPIYDPVTNTITNSDELEDDLQFDVEDFNRRVVTKSFNETVLHEIAKDIDPNEKGKTLIFAVDDAHADMITKILKDYYTEQGISEDAVMKITGSIENGNPVKIKEAIRRFKNETYPNIVITVDLLTTGIDVREIENLVFMRRIRSRILFEQMLGRATRLCPEIGKTHFEIYDAVGVYKALDPISTMKPVVANPSTTFEELVDGLDALTSDEARENQIELIIAKMRRSRAGMSDSDRAQFERVTGETPESFIDNIRHMPTDKAVETIKAKQEALSYVRRMPKEHEKFISDAKDELRDHIRGYGDATKPEDYLKEFSDYIDTHINEVMALNIVATRPKELTRKSLRELELILDANHFNETMLRTAWKEMTNEDIAADVISFIRQKTIGSALISRDDRIHNAIIKTKKAHPGLTKIQLGWLDRIEQQLLKEVVLNRETFDSAAFKNKGGFNAVNKAFEMKLDELIDEINGYMYTVA